VLVDVVVMMDPSLLMSLDECGRADAVHARERQPAAAGDIPAAARLPHKRQARGDTLIRSCDEMRIRNRPR